MRFCPYCGNAYSGGKFCGNCGGDLSAFITFVPESAPASLCSNAGFSGDIKTNDSIEQSDKETNQ